MTEASGEIVRAARHHAIRMDEFVGSTMGKIENRQRNTGNKSPEPGATVQGIMAAVSAGLNILKAAKGNRKTPRDGHAVEEDEEMFI